MPGNQSRFASRWACMNNPGGPPGHPHGTGRAPHAFCECGGRTVTERGMWGVFKEDTPPAGRTPDNAIKVYKQRSAAAGYCAAEGPGLVVDWISEDAL